MRCAFAPPDCELGVSAEERGRTSDSSVSDCCRGRPLSVGSGPVAALHHLVDRHKREIVFAVVHCTGGYLLITASALGLAALFARAGRWPVFGGRTALTAILLGLGYTVFSEWLNTQIRQSWSYMEAMPVLPPFGIGLTPFLQWLIVPGIAFGYVWHNVTPVVIPRR